jgi:hypothetical protein
MKMHVVFFTSTTTPLWSKSFAPQNVGQHVGMCVFLVAFATVFRLLVALRTNFSSFATAFKESRTRDHLLQPHNAADAEADHDDKVNRPRRPVETALFGLMDVIIAGVSYLL